MQKEALVPELVGAVTRNPALQQRVAGGIARVQAPMKALVDRAANAVSPEKIQPWLGAAKAVVTGVPPSGYEGLAARESWLRGVGHTLVEKPDVGAFTAAVPGGTVLAKPYLAARRGVESLLGRLAPSGMEVRSSVMSACLDHLLKEAAGAPTRGGFMMASDIPPWQQPDLGQSPTKRKFGGGIPPQESPSLPANDRYAGDGTSADSNEFHPPKVGEVKKKKKEKDGEGAGFCTWSPGDFSTVNPNAKGASKIGSALEVSTEKMAEFVRELLKEAAMPRASDLLRAGAPKVPHVGLKPPTSIPKSVSGIQMGHPTPGIAKQVKPTGPGMGNPAAGCVAGGAQGSLGAYKQQNRFTQGRMQV
jgi:hypothetical protein